MKTHTLYALLFVAELLLVTSCTDHSKTLEKVYADDQSVRTWVAKIGELSADEIISSKEQMSQTDSINQAIVASILDNDGWPTNISETANKAIWIVIDHADADYQLKYKELVREQAEKGVVAKADYAVFYDKLMMHLGKPQRYGSQVRMQMSIIGDERSVTTYLWPVEDAANLDSLRLSMELPPIQDYFVSIQTSSGLEVVWDKSKTVDDFVE